MVKTPRVQPTDEHGVYLVRSDTPGQSPWRVEVTPEGTTCGCEIEHHRRAGVPCKHCRWACEKHLEMLREDFRYFLNLIQKANSQRRAAGRRVPQP